MELPIKFDTIKSGWSIVYIEGSEVIISQKYIFSVKIDFVLANSADPDEMQHYTVFHLGIQCLLKYLFRGYWCKKGLV